ncbi:MAG: PAS domain S-box protein [Chloroflexi bacterium]|nr:PAS domain S-box protein [Chloroflexota bacterium]
MDNGEDQLDRLCARAENVVALSRDEFQKIPARELQTLIDKLVRMAHRLDLRVEQSRQTERECQTLTRRLTELFDLAPVGYFILNGQGVVTEANFTASHLLGAPRQELINQPFQSLVEPQYHLAFWAYLKEIAETGRVLSTEVEMMRRDNSVFHAQLQTVFISQGSSLTYRVSLADITERKRVEQSLRESEKRFRSVLDNMLEGSVILDFNWRYLYVNDAAVRLTGANREQRIGRTLMEVFPGIEQQDTFVHLKNCMENRTREQYETEFVFPGGRKAWFEVRCEPVPEGIFLLYLDITARKTGG